MPSTSYDTGYHKFYHVTGLQWPDNSSIAIGRQQYQVLSEAT